MLPPHRPGQHRLLGGREQLGRHGGVRHAVVPALAHRQLRAARIGARPQDVAVGRAHEQLDPDVAPRLGHDLQRVDLLVALAHRLHDQLERAPIRHQPGAVAAPLGQPDLVQQRIRRLGVEARPSRGQALVVQRAERQRRVGGGLGEVEVEGAVDDLAVDAQRQRPAEAHVAQQRAPAVVHGVEVRIECDVRGRPLRPKIRAVAAARLALLEQRDRLEGQAGGQQVHLARAGARGEQAAADHVHLQRVDVGQLPPVRVEAVVERVAPHREALALLALLVDPRLERGQVGVVVLVEVVELVVQLRPVARALALHVLRDLDRVAVVAVEAAHVMRGPVDEGRARRRQLAEELGVGVLPCVAHGGLVDDLEGRRLLHRAHVAGHALGAELRVVGNVLPPVAEVLRREGVAVGPAVPLAQVQREDPVVVGDLHVL